MNRKKTCLIAAALVALFAASASGVTLNFYQVSWKSAGGVPPNDYISRWSDWGRVEISLSAADHGRFVPMNAGGIAGWGGFINIATVGSPPTDWEIQNLPIFYTSPAELAERLPQGVAFDLGTPGVPITSLSYVLSVDPTPIAVKPVGPGINAAVTEFAYLVGGDRLWIGPKYLEGGGEGAPQPAKNFKGAAGPTGGTPAETIGSVAKIAVAETKVEKVSESLNGCAPAAVARSLTYMGEVHTNVDVPETAQNVYHELRDDMNTDAAGTATADILSGKNKYVARNKLPITSTQTTDFKKAMETLKNKGDVEVGVRWGAGPDSKSLGAHRAFVSEMQEIKDAAGNTTGYVVKIIDDVQADGQAINQTHTLKFDANGKLIEGGAGGAGAELINFQTEDVQAAKVPTTMLAAKQTLLPAQRTQPGIPSSRNAEAGPMARTQIGFSGVRDAGGNLFPLSSLVVNPAELPGPLDALAMDARLKGFVPPPESSTTLSVRLDLTHLMPDDVTRGQLLPILPVVTGEPPTLFLHNLVTTSSFFDVTYEVSLAGEDPLFWRLHGDVPAGLRGRVWLEEMETVPRIVPPPPIMPESFFDVFLELTATEEAYGDLAALQGATLLNMQLTAEQVFPLTIAAWAGGTADPPGSASLWSEPGNWNSTSPLPPGGPQAQVLFGNAGSEPIVDLAAESRTVGRMIFTGGLSATILSTEPVTPGGLILVNGPEDARISVYSGDTPQQHEISVPMMLTSNLRVTVYGSGDQLTLSGPMDGPSGLVLNGIGTVVLSGDNGYDGPTVVAGGLVHVTNASALPPGGNLTIGAGGTVVLSSDLSAAAGVGSAIGGSAAVPEPGTLALLAAGMLGAWALRMRRRA